ncbi:MAG TPA: hypothetical protein VHZ09_10920 [Acidobacteriaceae bacterium]|nr:hypothetical protein [Acidobacteriaceae bacterium]
MTEARSATELRREISARNLARGQQYSHEVSWGPSASVIFGGEEGTHGNFLPASWARISSNPAWRKRLTKSYAASRFVPRAQDRRRFELDCATSSDALLMNVFCYPRVLSRGPLCALLGIEPGLTPEFGFRPAVPLANGHADRTEIDMKLGHLLVEAKLTETDFQRAPLRMFSRYQRWTEVFDAERLPVRDGVVHSWQLMRGVLAAHATGRSFFVFCDRRRPDLIDAWFEVMRAVTDSSLRTRLGILTWQEIGATVPKPVRAFLNEKYGI